MRSSWKNLALAAVFLSAATLFASIVFQQRIRAHLLGLLEEEDLRVTKVTAAFLAGAADPRALASQIAGVVDARVTVIRLDGTVAADSMHDPETMDNHAARPEIADALATGWGQTIRHSSTLGGDMLYTAARIDDPDGKPVEFVRVARGLTAVDGLMQAVRQSLWAATAVVILLGILACYLFLELRGAREGGLRVTRVAPPGAEKPR